MKSFMSRLGLALLLLLATATTTCKSHEPNVEAEDFSEENELDEAPYVNQNEVGLVSIFLYRIYTKSSLPADSTVSAEG